MNRTTDSARGAALVLHSIGLGCHHPPEPRSQRPRIAPGGGRRPTPGTRGVRPRGVGLQKAPWARRVSKPVPKSVQSGRERREPGPAPRAGCVSGVGGVPVPPPSRGSAGAGGTGAGLRAGAGRAAREGLGETRRHRGRRGRGLRDGTGRARRGLRGCGGRRGRCLRAQPRGAGGCGNRAAAGGGGAPGGGGGWRGPRRRRRGSGRTTRARGGRRAALEQLQHALQLPAELRNLAVEVGDLQRGRKVVSPDGAGGPRTPGRPRTSRLSRTMLRSAASTSAASAGPRSAVPAEKIPHVAGIPSLLFFPSTLPIPTPPIWHGRTWWRGAPGRALQPRGRTEAEGSHLLGSPVVLDSVHHSAGGQ